MTAPLTPERERLAPGPASWQRRWYAVIFQSDTPAGKAFDLVLLVLILVSVLAVMLETVAPLQARYGEAFKAIEWCITLLFTAEFFARVACVDRWPRYAFSFFGVVDLVSVLPTYLALFFTGAHTLAVIRTLRLLRVFRVLKLTRHVSEAQTLLIALRQTWPKITVFLLVVFCTIVIAGTLMYLIEVDRGSGFDNIPVSVYWAIVTMTTVGYGDLAPSSTAGRLLAALLMLFGYAVIIVPTGIFSAQVITTRRARPQRCGACAARVLADNARYCHRCGEKLGAG